MAIGQIGLRSYNLNWERREEKRREEKRREEKRREEKRREEKRREEILFGVHAQVSYIYIY
jgi:hypothetical protein